MSSTAIATRLLLLAGLMALPAPAQSVPPLPPRLTGLALQPFATPQPMNTLIRSIAFNATGACGRETICAVGLTTVVGAPPYAGGSAYDSTGHVLWASNGKLVAAYVDGLNGVCEAKCPPVPVPGLAGDEWVTGMGFRDLTRRLYCVIVRPAAGALPLQHRIAWYVPQACGLTQQGSCIIPPSAMPIAVGGQPYIIGGADIFEQIRVGTFASNPVYGSYLVMIASLWQGQIPPGANRNVVLIHQIDSTTTNPCQRRCTNNLVFPDIGAITGLALEGANNLSSFGVHRIWATSGSIVTAVTPGIPGNGDLSEPCSLTPVTGCTASAQASWVGLTVLPGYVKSAGAACNEPICPCSLSLVANSDPNYCNLGFQMYVTGGPPSTNGALTFGTGACVPTAACANAFTPSGALTSIGFAFAGASVACGASYIHSFSLGSPALIGLTVSAVANGACPGGGNLQSNCLVWTWTGH